MVHNETRKALKKAHWLYVNGILSDGLENGDTKPFYTDTSNLNNKIIN